MKMNIAMLYSENVNTRILPFISSGFKASSCSSVGRPIRVMRFTESSGETPRYLYTLLMRFLSLVFQLIARCFIGRVRQ